jgi:hypothetical protein
MDFAEQLQEHNFLDCVMTGDETWYYQCDPEAKEATNVKVQIQNNVNQTFCVEVLKKAY